MSYDIDLKTFTAEPLLPKRLEGALAILARYGARSEGPRFHSHSVRWDDGSGFAIYSQSLFDDSVPFNALLTPLGGLSPRFCDFAYEFASEVGCAICPDVIPPLVLLVPSALPGPSPDQVRAKSKVIRVSNGPSVHRALAESYQGWRNLLHDAARQINEAFQRDPLE
jgi:hypothetical protein